MTAQADPIYLPILTPARIEVGVRTLLEQRASASARQQVRPRLYRVPPRPVDEGLVYSPDGTVGKKRVTGLAIDLFA